MSERVLKPGIPVTKDPLPEAKKKIRPVKSIKNVRRKKPDLSKELLKGFLKDNPLLALLLGTCPALAVTTSAVNGLGMGVATTCVLLMSNLIISLLRKVIPDKVRIPSFITVIASLVTMVGFILEAYSPALNEALGVFIPLITVNCIILGRAEAFANKHKPLAALADGAGMGLGFTAALFCIGGLREILGNGSIFGWAIPFIGEDKLIQPMSIFIMPPGGFFVFAIMIAVSQALIKKFYAGKPDSPVYAADFIKKEEPSAMPEGMEVPGPVTSGEAKLIKEGQKRQEKAKSSAKPAAGEKDLLEKTGDSIGDAGKSGKGDTQ